MSDGVTIHHIDAFRALAAAGAVAGIWRDANGMTEEDGRAFAAGTFPKHVTWPDFRLYMAAVDHHPVGFVYGYRSLPGQWWHDEVAGALTQAGQGSWLQDAIELAEIAVAPAMQGRGIGTRLIDAFLEGLTSSVVLAVEASETRTHVLYAAHGFRDLLNDFHYAGWDDDRIVIMGRQREEAS